MEQQRRPRWLPAENEAGQRIAQIAHVQELVEQIAGTPPTASDAMLDRGARIGAAYEAALPVMQKRFDALAAETAAWAAVAARTLVGGDQSSRAPAERLAAELAGAQREMARILGL